MLQSAFVAQLLGWPTLPTMEEHCVVKKNGNVAAEHTGPSLSYVKDRMFCLWLCCGAHLLCTKASGLVHAAHNEAPRCEMMTTTMLLPDPLDAASLTSEIGCYVEQIVKSCTHELDYDVWVLVWHEYRVVATAWSMILCWPRPCQSSTILRPTVARST